jgi:hypothetical protein
LLLRLRQSHCQRLLSDQRQAVAFVRARVFGIYQQAVLRQYRSKALDNL